MRAIGGDCPSVFVDLPVTLVAGVFLLVVLLVNLVLTAVELTGLLVVAGLGASAVLTGEGDLSRPGDVEGDGIFGATALACYAQVGFED